MSGASIRRILSAVAAAAFLHLLLVMPDLPAELTPAALVALPLELPVILLLLLAVGDGRAGRALRGGLTLVLTSITLLKLADLAMRSALGRPFNPVADLPLIDASVRLVAGAVGPAAAAAAVVGAVLLALILAAGLWWATGVWARLRPPRHPRLAAGALAASVALFATQAGHAAGKWHLPLAWAGDTDTTRFVLARAALAQRTVTELRAFRVAAAEDRFGGATGLMNRIDRDVMVIFVESYGRTSFDTPFYAEDHLPLLHAAEERLAAAGLAMRSSFLTSPTQGGQSWLAHATFANGLEITDQTRYQAALASGRASLFHQARRAGFRTAAVMPGITRPWPEAAQMGFDEVFAASDLGYRGKPFNWVTMPDQFTLAAADRLLPTPSDPRRSFTEIALLSSHAPWTPVPHLLDCDTLGDGQVFDAMAVSGDPPDVVWRDRERVRTQYRDCISYTLETLTEYVLRHAANPPLLFILGDHQAAPGIALDDRREVPFHVIGPAALVDPTRGWGLAPGLIPAESAKAIPMERMRDLILGTFTEGASAPPPS